MHTNQFHSPLSTPSWYFLVPTQIRADGIESGVSARWKSTVCCRVIGKPGDLAQELAENRFMGRVADYCSHYGW